MYNAMAGLQILMVLIFRIVPVSHTVFAKYGSNEVTTHPLPVYCLHSPVFTEIISVI